MNVLPKSIEKSEFEKKIKVFEKQLRTYEAALTILNEC